MATYLYRLGRWAFRRRKTVLVTWLVALIALIAVAAGFGRSADAQVSIPGVEAVQASTLLQERFPSVGAGGAAARVVFQAPVGKTLSDPAVKTAVEQTLAIAAKEPQVGQVSDPYKGGGISADGRTGYATVSYTANINNITDAARQGLLDSATPARAAGLTVNFGGEATKAVAASAATEGIGVLIALLVLALTFGSLLAAGLPPADRHLRRRGRRGRDLRPVLGGRSDLHHPHPRCDDRSRRRHRLRPFHHRPAQAAAAHRHGSGGIGRAGRRYRGERRGVRRRDRRHRPGRTVGRRHPVP